MNQPIHTRRSIPFFHDKTEAEFRHDVYERYDEVVQRHTALHLADGLWQGYPFRPVVDWVLGNLPTGKNLHLADIGCGVGRLAAEIAQNRPTAQVWGLDFSYQMLRRAQEFWVEGETLELDWSARGFPPCQLVGQRLENLHFGLAKAEKLPFDGESQHALACAFLLDRLDEPALALREMRRVLRPGGRLLLVSPLNFHKKENWQQLHPVGRLLDFLKNLGFKLENWDNSWALREPLDVRGNHLTWNCLRLVASRPG